MIDDQLMIYDGRQIIHPPTHPTQPTGASPCRYLAKVRDWEQGKDAATLALGRAAFARAAAARRPASTAGVEDGEHSCFLGILINSWVVEAVVNWWLVNAYVVVNDG